MMVYQISDIDGEIKELEDITLEYLQNLTDQDEEQWYWQYFKYTDNLIEAINLSINIKMEKSNV